MTTRIDLERSQDVAGTFAARITTLDDKGVDWNAAFYVPTTATVEEFAWAARMKARAFDVVPGIDLSDLETAIADASTRLAR